MASTLLSACLALLVAASGLSLIPQARRLRTALALSAAASALALVAAADVVATSGAATLTLWKPSPYAALDLRLDPLGGVFMAIVAGVALASSVFGTGYARHRLIDDLVYPLFILTLLLVTCSANVYTFLVAWEGMALTSFVLVLGDGATSRRQAAILYLVMTHVATVFVAASFFIIAREAGSTDFSAMSGVSLSVPMASLAFLFAVAGFGTKAGLIPLHIWLPRAHPVAPSHVSALMSAAMVKTGLYGIARVSLVFLGPGEPWWGIALMSAGAVSAVLGVLYALMERDIKRILAYSTVENVGIIAIGLGAAIALRAEGRDALAGAALTAALLHATNHAWFKTLLFLSAGSVQRAAQTLNLDRLGGLAASDAGDGRRRPRRQPGDRRAAAAQRVQRGMVAAQDADRCGRQGRRGRRAADIAHRRWRARPDERPRDRLLRPDVRDRVRWARAHAGGKRRTRTGADHDRRAHAARPWMHRDGRRRGMDRSLAAVRARRPVRCARPSTPVAPAGSP